MSEYSIGDCREKQLFPAEVFILRELEKKGWLLKGDGQEELCGDEPLTRESPETVQCVV